MPNPNATMRSPFAGEDGDKMRLDAAVAAGNVHRSPFAAGFEPPVDEDGEPIVAEVAQRARLHPPVPQERPDVTANREALEYKRQELELTAIIAQAGLTEDGEVTDLDAIENEAGLDIDSPDGPEDAVEDVGAILAQPTSPRRSRR
jgi:hypothetical protein